ncbi:heme-binding Shp domain-containing protein [Eubacterium oxidoreducens]|uniref:Cell surface heme-binding protein Shp n=1 Tax=Eubacterium oxidoreducens TaxID=1732 RepID=A0A1G6A3B4_EUBOX|nr:heme-binding Shp domain-containing protein [Eubacterium oxidoreducens]SDB02840.1 Cell surface heme-binding protein Shp [Eubacterium oxidoreducens]
MFGKINQKTILIWAVGLCMVGMFLLRPLPALAAAGTVYTVDVVRSYSHPVTGEIEDAGGESGAATGQGMVEGVVKSTGIMEITDSGSYYITVELSLIDETSDQKFQVQKQGDTSWSNPELGITGTGSDSNGTTDYVCIKLPSKDGIVRCSMYVEQMGREVVFYFYAENLTEGNSTGLPATLVTTASKSDAEDEEKEDTSEEELTETAGDTSEEELTESAGDTSENQGLTLSTEREVSDTEEDDAGGGNRSFAEQLALNIISGVVVGLILLFAAAGIVYLFLKKRKEWFYDAFDDPDWEDEDKDHE